MLDTTNPISPFFNVQAEESLLGAILIEGKPVMARVSAIVGAGDFYIPRNSYIFEACQSLDDIDFVTVADKLSAMGKLTDSGGDMYLTHLMTQFVSSANIETYAHTVKGYAIRRAIVETARGIVQGLSQDADTDPTTQLQGFISQLQKIKLPAMSQDYKSIVQGYVSEKENLWNDPTQRAGLSWGIPAMDIAFGEIKPQQLVMIMGATGQGKSWVLALLINHWLNRGVRVGLWTGEMANSEVFDRLIEIRCGVNFDDLMDRRRALMANKKMSDAQKETELATIERDYKRFLHEVSKVYQLPFHISDRPCSIDEVESLLYEWEQEADKMVDVLVLDYLGLLSTNSSDKDYERIAHISQVAKQKLAKKHNLAVISAMQANRQGYGAGELSLEHMARSMSPAQDSDKVIGIMRDKTDSSLITLSALKLRSKAGGGDVKLKQDGAKFMVLTNREER